MKSNKGFSLIELSIVLIIMGLLVVASVKGYSLMMASKVLKLNQELYKYAFASEQFTALYGQYPGLYKDAVAKFGSEAKLKAVDDQNGDYINESGSPTDANSLNFFNHLYLSGLLDEGEKYIGSNTDLSSKSGITYNSGYYPTLKSDKSLYPYVTSTNFSGYYNKINRLSFASYGNNDNYGIDLSIIRSLDHKFDDDLPDSGIFSLDIDNFSTSI